ncbi:MarR family winged helix-turn-helix transcriptional regulator [Pseudonocardia aurantiaca]|uniref:MarR family winged helix-turn-helix transcriptional regulator n=1 Tax=Pseudonocardia aurantiaca TaxID=75290 RepID=A0ABW4FCH3_9PSEU
MGFIRAFGLLSNDQTPCGQPMAPSDAHALTEIAEGVLTQRALVDRLHLDRSSVSRLVDRLVARGWVERVGGAEDRRTVRLAATPAGQRVAAEIARSRAERFAALIDAVPRERRDDVLDAIQLLKRAARTRGGTA